ncbi:hypothetical protein [Streptomyces chartreusis]|uniref:hypothetical protein n=1 Tax=Streptomyces chartreusis TaxID=1969 RepID=UPI003695CABF
MDLLMELVADVGGHGGCLRGRCLIVVHQLVDGGRLFLGAGFGLPACCLLRLLARSAAEGQYARSAAGS